MLTAGEVALSRWYHWSYRNSIFLSCLCLACGLYT